MNCYWLYFIFTHPHTDCTSWSSFFTSIRRYPSVDHTSSKVFSCNLKSTNCFLRYNTRKNCYFLDEKLNLAADFLKVYTRLIFMDLVNPPNYVHTAWWCLMIIFTGPKRKISVKKYPLIANFRNIYLLFEENLFNPNK